MKFKIFLIFLITFAIVGYLFYSMDTSVLKTSKENNSENNKVTEENIKKDTDVKAADNKKEENKEEIKRIETKNKSEDLENKNVRNIFKTHYRADKKEVKVEVVKEIKKRETVAEFARRFRVSFTMKSDYDSLAIINNKKYRIGDVLSGEDLKGKIIDIDEDSVVMSVGTREIELSIRK